MNNATKIVIATLERHYSAPVPKLTSGIENLTYRMLVADYLKALAPFADDALDAGMRDFVETWKHTRWPKIGELVTFMRDARQAAREIPGGKTWQEGFFPAVTERCENFVSDFMSGTLARQAHDEGWSDQLRQYVRRVAWYQAQIIERCDRKGKAFSCRAKGKDGKQAYPNGHIEFFQLDELERHGAMTVNIPTEQIEAMKRRAKQQEQHGKEREKPSYIPGLPNMADDVVA